MNNYWNQAQYINEELREQLTEWLNQWVQWNTPEAYDEQNPLSLYAIRRAMNFLLEQCVFMSVREIKLHFGKTYKTILPDFIFEKTR